MFTALDAPPEKLDKHEQNFVANVRQHGWFAMHVGSDAGGPEFSYTTGFWLKFSHPELIVFSLSRQVAHDTFWHLYREIESGRRFAVGDRIGDVFENAPAMFLPVAQRNYGNHLGWSRWFYGGDDFQCLQLLWTDRDGHFPWSSEAPADSRAAQPDLTEGNWFGLHAN
jgi:hypothetical protein